MALSGIAGCGNEQSNAPKVEVAKEGYPIVNEPITLDMFGCKAAVQGEWKDMIFFKELEKKTGISFNYNTPSAESINERKNIAFASNDLPDLFFAVEFEPSEVQSYANQKQLIPLEDLIDEYCPNIKKIFEDYPEIKRDLTASDGHIYGLTSMDLNGGSPQRFFINKKWLDAVGLPIPQTTDEFTAAMQAFKDQDPNGNGQQDELPLSLTGTWQFNWLAGAFGILPHDNGMYDENGTMVFCFTDERYRDYLRWLNELYAKGLMDSESFTQSGAQQTAKGNDGLLGSFFSAAPFVTAGQANNDQYVWQPALKGPNGDQLWIKGQALRERLCFVVTTENPYPEATMRWIDTLYAPDASTFVNVGVEGITYEKLDNGLYQSIVPEGYSNFEEYRGKEVTPAAGGAIPTASYPRKEGDKVFVDDEENIKMQQYDQECYGPYAKVRYPILYFTDAQNRELSTIQTDLKTYVDNMRARFIMGDASLDNDWDSYCEQIKKMRVDDFVKIYQEALDTRNANN